MNSVSRTPLGGCAPFSAPFVRQSAAARAALALVLGGLIASGAVAQSTYYVAPPPLGDDSNSGDSTHPWATPSISSRKLNQGDTLFITYGTYDDRGSIDITQSGIDIIGLDQSGSDTFDDPASGPTIDGTAPEYRTPDENTWELYSQDEYGAVYRTKNSYETHGVADDVGGWYEYNGRPYALIRYSTGKAYKNLLAAEQRIDPATYWMIGGPVYCGPGVYYDANGVIDGTAKRIYIRLTQTEYMDGMSDLPEDPGQLSIFIVDDSKSRIQINREGPNTVKDVVIRGINFRGLGATAYGNVNRMTIDHCTFTLGSVWLKQPDGDTQPFAFTISHTDFNLAHPSYVAWNDVKLPNRIAPARRCETAAIAIGSFWSYITISDCKFDRAWDGIMLYGSDSVTIANCTFSENRDDCIQVLSDATRLSIHDNRMVGAAACVSRTGNGDPSNIGSKYIHHNVMHVDRRYQLARKTILDCYISEPDGPICCPPDCDGTAVNAPFGFHLDRKFGESGDPWFIFNNTVLSLDSDVGIGYGLAGICPRPTREIGRHTVYNNIFIQSIPTAAIGNVSDFTLDDSMDLDGDLFYRMGGNGSLWTRVDNPGDLGSPCQSGDKKDFKTFESFRDYSGWEERGAYGDPQLHLDDPDHPELEYAPEASTRCAACAVEIPQFDIDDNATSIYRGARAPLGGGCDITRGDVNCDGAIDFRDIDAFTIALLGPADYCAAFPECNYLNADLNCDGQINFDDISPFVTCLFDDSGTCNCP